MAFLATDARGLVLGHVAGIRAATVGACILLSFADSAHAQIVNRITGNERLAWDQARLDPLVPTNAYDFSLHVDGARYALGGVLCSADSLAFMTCSTPLPTMAAGQHVLQLSTAVGGRESEWSEAMIVIVSPSQTLLSTSSARASDGAYKTTTLVAMERPIGDVAIAGNGKVFFVEDGRHVRVVLDGALLAEPALTVDRATHRLIALAADVSFAETRIVTAAWLDESVPGAPTLSIARFREVNNVLGQRAIVVNELPVPASHDPQVEWDATGQIYIAFPAPLPSERSHPYGGTVLRLASDGTAPKASGQNSPVFANGIEHPTSVAFDPALQRLWVAGEADSVWQLASLSSAYGGGAQVVRGARSIVSISPSTDPDGPLFIVEDDGGLYEVSRRTAAFAPEQVTLVEGDVVEVSAGADGVYVVLSVGASPSSVFTLLKLARR